jgi:Flp pilus assembly pilin Flp
MIDMRSKLKVKTAELARCEAGNTAVEYGLIAALIAGALMLAAVTFGSAVGGTFTYIASALKEPGAPSSGG